MVVESCAFTTRRLVVGDRHRVETDRLPRIVAGMLTPDVTRSLPPGWGGAYDEARAKRWIADRDAEGTTLVVAEDGTAVGLVLLHEEAVSGGVDVRLGYLLAEHAWGRGLGGELLGGLVARCRADPTLHALIAGVAPDNIPSVRLLERHGFVLDDEEHGGGELTYRLEVA